MDRALGRDQDPLAVVVRDLLRRVSAIERGHRRGPHAQFALPFRLGHHVFTEDGTGQLVVRNVETGAETILP